MSTASRGDTVTAVTVELAPLDAGALFAATFAESQSGSRPPPPSQCGTSHGTALQMLGYPLGGRRGVGRDTNPRTPLR